MAEGLQYAFDPRTTGAGLRGRDIVAVAIWSLIGIYLMLRFLRAPAGEQA